MIFVETQLFTKQLPRYLSDDEYGELQSFLVSTPDAGDIIQDTGGLRKIRWAAGGKGKRGGIRVIYYWQMAEDHIYFVTLYAKSETEDLSAQDKKMLRQLIERWI